MSSPPPDLTATCNKALEALARRARSCVELDRWLAQRGHLRGHIDAAVERLTALGYLNDAEYACAFARSRMTPRGMSGRRVRLELERRGVARDVADQAVAQVLRDDHVDERALAAAAAAKKLRSLAHLERAVRRRRLLAFLARRGFPHNLALDTVRGLLAERP